MEFNEYLSRKHPFNHSPGEETECSEWMPSRGEGTSDDDTETEERAGPARTHTSVLRTQQLAGWPPGLPRGESSLSPTSLGEHAPGLTAISLKISPFADLSDDI